MGGIHAGVLHLARRGLEASVSIADKGDHDGSHDGERPQFKIPVGGSLLMAFTLFCFIILIVSIRYTLWSVVATLTMIENTEPTYALSASTQPSGTPLSQRGDDQEVLEVKPEPITCRIRKTIRHIHAHGGFKARWRGAAPALVYFAAYIIISQPLQALFAVILRVGLLAQVVASIVTGVLLARLSLAWTHIVISEPSPKRWYRRIPGMKAWRTILVPAALNEVATQFAFLLPALCFLAMGLNNPEKVRQGSPTSTGFKALAIALVTLIAFVGLILPAKIAYVRIQASMLPEEDEAIVPFDRTFRGKVEPAIVGGTGRLGWMDAWRSIDHAAGRRIGTMMAKMLLIDIALNVSFVLVFGAQAYLIIGGAIRKFFDQGGA